MKRGLVLAQTMPYPYAEGRCLFQLGVLHTKLHDRESARSSLEAALVIFSRLGARKDVEQAEICLDEFARA